jgi:hypothetical protein
MDSANVISICCVCNRVRGQAVTETHEWKTLNAFLQTNHIGNGDYRLTHTYCPTCADQFKALYASPRGRNLKRPETIAKPAQSHATEAILEVFSSVQNCDLDMLVRACPTLTWNQVFSEVDRLSRLGKLRLNYLGRGHYSIELPENADMPLVAQT